MARIFHLIANAHLDPVWQWDWREGLNEALTTCRTILDLMDEDKELTFNRGESVIYEHIERTDPETFARIRRRIREGRWDVIGGTYLQTDMNLPATETIVRQYVRGQEYFRRRFGKPVRAGWSADCFGHTAGLPEILREAGIEFYAFTRPDARALPIPKPAFWWEGAGGSRVLAYRPYDWYGCEPDSMGPRLDRFLEASAACDLENVALFYGLGNHGGGPTRRMLKDIRQWRGQHPEVQVVHSTLHRFFDLLAAEVAGKAKDFLPVHRGEMNFALRGCYASVAKFKHAYRRAQAAVSQAETTASIVSTAVKSPRQDLAKAWDAIMFNAFHDILTGTSVERAFEEQAAWIGGAHHAALGTTFDSLNALARQVDTRVAKPARHMPSGVSFLLWNSHPRPYEGYVEFEAMLDYRPIWKYENRPGELPTRMLGPTGRPIGFQTIISEAQCCVSVPWRKRVAVPVKLPPMGYTMIEYAYVDQPPQAPLPARPVTADGGAIDNGHYRVEVSAGAAGVRVFRNGTSIFGDGELGAVVVNDPWGSWGGMDEAPESFNLRDVRERWTVQQTQLLESGPHLARLWVRLAGRRSRLDLTFTLYADRDAVDVSARVLWDESGARLKLVLPAGEAAEFDVPGATIARPPCGEVPAVGWVRVHGPAGAMGFASDLISSFDCADGCLRPTICRASQYATENRDDAISPWKTIVDRGELTLRFVLTPGGDELPRLAEDLAQPPIVLPVPPHEGTMARKGSLAQVQPAGLTLLALSPAGDGKGLILRLQNRLSKSVQPRLTLMGQTLRLDRLPAGQIGNWRLTPSRRGWSAKRTNLLED